MLAASIVVIGDEILGGFVQDTNSHWLAGVLQQHGVPLDRIVTVPDEMAAIDEALQGELSRPRPRVIVTTGGIGSTPDDITYEAVAASLGRDLVSDPTLSARIDGALEWTAGHGIEVDAEFADHLHRMGRVPEGARLIDHPGWAPGLRLDLDGGSDDGGVTVLILPGVPSQVRAIVTQAVGPTLLAGRNPATAVRELTHRFPESVLNPCLARLIADHAAVKVGSYPGAPMIVRLSGPPDAVDAAYEDLEAYVRGLEADPAGERLADAWSQRRGGDGDGS